MLPSAWPVKKLTKAERDGSPSTHRVKAASVAPTSGAMTPTARAKCDQPVERAKRALRLAAAAEDPRRDPRLGHVDRRERDRRRPSRGRAGRWRARSPRRRRQARRPTGAAGGSSDRRSAAPTPPTGTRRRRRTGSATRRARPRRNKRGRGRCDNGEACGESSRRSIYEMTDRAVAARSILEKYSRCARRRCARLAFGRRTPYRAATSNFGTHHGL